MLYLAQRSLDNYIPLKDIAAVEDISLKYLEGIMTSLSKAKLVDGAHGKGGGTDLPDLRKNIQLETFCG